MKIKTVYHGVFEGREQWTAIDEDKGLDAPIGIGETAEAATQDLREQVGDNQ